MSVIIKGVGKVSSGATHVSDCSSNNLGVPELYGDCDCGGEARAQRKYTTYFYLLCYNQLMRYLRRARQWGVGKV